MDKIEGSVCRLKSKSFLKEQL